MDTKAISRLCSRRIAVLTVAAAVAAGLAGCGGGGEETAPATVPPATEAAPPTTEAAPPATTEAAPPATETEEAPANYPVTDYVAYTGGTAGPADTSLEPVVIGWVNNEGGQILVGPTATNGAEFAVQYVNEKLGGVGGHPIELHKCAIKNAEEEGQTCGQELLNDSAVNVVNFGGVAVGANSFESVIAGTKPIIIGVSVNAADATNPNTYILAGAQQLILEPYGSFASEVFDAKTAAVVYPETPGIQEGAAAIRDGLEAAVCTELFQDILSVISDRDRADVELLSDQARHRLHVNCYVGGQGSAPRSIGAAGP